MVIFLNSVWELLWKVEQKKCEVMYNFKFVQVLSLETFKVDRKAVIKKVGKVTSDFFLT